MENVLARKWPWGFKIENVQARKWPMYLGIAAGSVTVAGFALATMIGNVSWMILPLITSIVGIEMAATSVFTLKGLPKNPLKVANPVPVQVTNIEQIAATIEKPAITAEEIENLPHIVVKTENSVPKIDIVKPAPSMVNSNCGIYIDSMDVVRQQLSQIKSKETKKVSEMPKERVTVKKIEREIKKKAKVKPHIKNTRRKIVRLVKPTARA